MQSSSTEFNTVDEYIALFPAPVQEKLHALRQVIKEAAPDAQETIKYRMPTYVYHGNLVHFAAFKTHIGFYPTPSGTDAAVAGLSAYKTGKGTLQFPLSEPLPLPLIRQVVEIRVQENLARATAKRR